MVAVRRPRHPGHGVEPQPEQRDVLEPEILIEAFGQIPDDVAGARRHQHDVDLPVLAVEGDGRNHLAGGRRFNRDHDRIPGAKRIRRQVPAVVRRALLFAERLEPLVEILLELVVEVFRRQVEHFIVDIPAAGDGAAPQPEHEAPDAVVAPAALDELEHRMPQVVDDPSAGEPAVAIEAGHRRHGIRDREVPDLHDVQRPPDARHEVGEPLVDPQRHALADDAARNDVELEDVRQFVRDEAVQSVRTLVDRQHDPVPLRFGERADALGTLSGKHVLLLEFAVGLEDDERDDEGEVVPQAGADLLVRALGVAGNPLQVLFHFGVVVDLEVVGLVYVPVEVVVLDAVLAPIGEEFRLGVQLRAAAAGQRQRQQDGKAGSPRGPGTTVSHGPKLLQRRHRRKAPGSGSADGRYNDACVRGIGSGINGRAFVFVLCWRVLPRVPGWLR